MQAGAACFPGVGWSGFQITQEWTPLYICNYIKIKCSISCVFGWDAHWVVEEAVSLQEELRSQIDRWLHLAFVLWGFWELLVCGFMCSLWPIEVEGELLPPVYRCEGRTKFLDSKDILSHRVTLTLGWMKMSVTNESDMIKKCQENTHFLKHFQTKLKQLIFSCY